MIMRCQYHGCFGGPKIAILAEEALHYGIGRPGVQSAKHIVKNRHRVSNRPHEPGTEIQTAVII